MIKKNSLRLISVFTFLVLLCGTAIVFSEFQSERQNLISQSIKPSVSTIVQKQVISGNLYPIKEIDVKSAIPGILEKYFVQIGDEIRAGDEIAKIKILSEPSEIEKAKSNLKTATISFNREKLNFERDKKLFEKKMISDSEFENTTKNYQIYKEQYEYAKNQLHLLEEGYIPSSNISNVVLATVDGTIIDLPLEEGTQVVERNNFRDGTTVAIIAQLDSFIFKGKIVESDVLALKKGMKLKVIPASMTNFSTEATIRKISPKGYWEQGAMKYDIEATFILPDSIQIYSGFNASAEFVQKAKNNILTLPEASLIFLKDSVFVDVLESNEFKRRKVEIGISDGLNIEIVSGINENDYILKR